MINLTDIHSLTDFQRNTKEHIARLKATGRPLVLTVNGKAEVVVQDAESYQHLLDLLDRTVAIEGIRRALEDVRSPRSSPCEHGRTQPLREALDEISRKHDIQGLDHGPGEG